MAASKGSAGMNVNSGGPHLLLFERDQQLTALLTSEFQLAGYECHAARTAVEVFDAIARYPVRFVLVNLAQAAAGRREFWVALDAQRRGRGVQVFTFRCMNLAGYGVDDPDDRTRTVMADMEVDGMLGVMNLVDAVRARIPGSTTGSSSRIPATPVASRQAGTREAASASAPQVAVAPSPSVTGQATSPLPTLASNGTSSPSAASPQPTSSPTLQRPQQSVPGLPVPQTGLPTSSMPASPTVAPSAPSPSPVPTVPPLPAGPGNTPSSFTDKIRAVIYPSSRNFAQIPAGQEIGRDQWNAQNPQNQPSANSFQDETGLERLSRMIREQAHPVQEDEARSAQQAQSSGMQETLPEGQVTRRPADSPPIGGMSLRASPIQDIAIERGAGGMASGGTGWQIGSQEAEPSQQSQRSDASLHTRPAAFVPPSIPTPEVMPIEPVNQEVVGSPLADAQKDESSSSFTEDRPTPVGPLAEPAEQRRRPGDGVSIPSRPSIEESPIGRSLVGAPLADAQKVSVQGAIRRNEAETSASSDETLLNIVQSFPPMPSPSQQPQQSQPPVLSGRATRSLGSVLLEGHLVPQHRLEVAQHIQRMLRGVDMNYQLGEILLMFKLLTPDQLLAASLVSYGLISTMQISALGRIRQELHSIGLEYDLESLLVLFRILSPEQLREVRASWSG